MGSDAIVPSVIAITIIMTATLDRDNCLSIMTALDCRRHTVSTMIINTVEGQCQLIAQTMRLSLAAETQQKQTLVIRHLVGLSHDNDVAVIISQCTQDIAITTLAILRCLVTDLTRCCTEETHPLDHTLGCWAHCSGVAWVPLVGVSAPTRHRACGHNLHCSDRGVVWAESQLLINIALVVILVEGFKGDSLGARCQSSARLDLGKHDPNYSLHQFVLLAAVQVREAHHFHGCFSFPSLLWRH